MSRGIDSRRETPPPTRHSISVSERLPASEVFAPPSCVPLGRWSVPITSTVSVEVSMFPPEVSAACASDGTPPDCTDALMMNRITDSASHATSATSRPMITRFGVIRRPVPRSGPPLYFRYSTGPWSSSSSPRRRAFRPFGPAR